MLATTASRKLRVLKTESPDGPPDSPIATASPPGNRGRALAWLLAATILWAVSFPLGKALLLAQQRWLPGADTLFLVALDLMIRFGVAGLVVAFHARRTIRSLDRREFHQGLGLGIFAAGGMLLQVDGLNYTSASSSAFLSSSYCVTIPLIVVLLHRHLPSLGVAACSAAVFVGLGVLSGVEWRRFQLGRGECETLVGSLFFAGQILWLERPRFARNRPAHATAVMFGVLTVAVSPVMITRLNAPAQLVRAAMGTAPIWGLLLMLTLFCTLIPFSVMNRWQRFVTATEAGLIYCAEPVWTSLISLWLPGCLMAWTGIVYPNETVTVRLLVGGGLITVANAGLQLLPRTAKRD